MDLFYLPLPRRWLWLRLRLTRWCVCACSCCLVLAFLIVFFLMHFVTVGVKSGTLRKVKVKSKKGEHTGDHQLLRYSQPE